VGKLMDAPDGSDANRASPTLRQHLFEIIVHWSRIARVS
jgi:hypothetical protein